MDNKNDTTRPGRVMRNSQIPDDEPETLQQSNEPNTWHFIIAGALVGGIGGFAIAIIIRTARAILGAV